MELGFFLMYIFLLSCSSEYSKEKKIIEKSVRFRNLRFLGFYKECMLKIVFLHDQGHQKQAKIN